jgi:hypothetical protein
MAVNCEASIWLEILAVILVVAIFIPGGLFSMPAISEEQVRARRGLQPGDKVKW